MRIFNSSKSKTVATATTAQYMDAIGHVRSGKSIAQVEMLFGCKFGPHQTRSLLDIQSAARNAAANDSLHGGRYRE